MRFTKKIDYGLVLLSDIQDSFFTKKFVSILSVAHKHNLPYAFLEKLALSFSKAGIMEARRGCNGGYRLKKDPKKITIEDVVSVFEEPKMTDCLSFAKKGTRCLFLKTCPTRNGFIRLDGKINDIFRKTTLASL